MTDHFDDPFLAASAYLDGELTVAEAARAESDPDVMAEVDALRAIRAEVRSVAPPTDDVRETAISAAMAAFADRPAADADAADEVAVPGETLRPVGDRARSTDARPAPPTSIAARRRRRSSLFLGAAAAAVVVLAAGAVVVRVGGGGDDDDAAFDARPDMTSGLSGEQRELGDETAETEIAEAPTEEGEAAADDGVVAGGDMAAAEAADDTGDAGTDAAATAPPLDGDTVEEAAEDAAESGDVGAGLLISEASDVDPATVPTDDEVVALVTGLIDQIELGDLPPTPNTRCRFGDDRVLAEVLDEELFDTELGARELLVGVDDGAGTALAVDPLSCELVVEAPLD